MRPTDAGRPLLALALALAACPSPTNGQEWTLGARGGYSEGSFSGRQIAGLDAPRRGTAVGLAVGRRISRRVVLEPELLRTQWGGSSVLENSALAVEIAYLEAPLLARVELRPDASVVPFLRLGAALAVEVRCDLRFRGGTLSRTESCEDNGGAGLRLADTDYRAVAGAGIRMPAGRADILMEGRWNQGIVARDPATVGGVPTRTRGWALLFGLAWVPGRCQPSDKNPEACR
jgi:hypothetical protein